VLELASFFQDFDKEPLITLNAGSIRTKCLQVLARRCFEVELNRSFVVFVKLKFVSVHFVIGIINLVQFAILLQDL